MSQIVINFDIYLATGLSSVVVKPHLSSAPSHLTIKPAGPVQLRYQVSENSTPQRYAKTAHSGSFKQTKSMYNKHDIRNKINNLTIYSLF